jgi:hypothetical protein
MKASAFMDVVYHAGCPKNAQIRRCLAAMGWQAYSPGKEHGWGEIMPRRFLGIRLLLVFVAINTILFGMLVTSLTSDHPWLGDLLPGQFGGGASSSGYWVFFSLVLFVNAVTVLIAGFVLMFSAMLEGGSDEKKLSRHLGNLADDQRESILASHREEAASAHTQMIAGRSILIAGAVFVTLAFAGVTLSFAGASPEQQMFRDNGYAVSNAEVTRTGVGLFTADQLLGAFLLDLPEIYDWHVGTLTNNVAQPLFTHFVFAFRTAMGLIALMLFASILRPAPKPREASAGEEGSAEEDAPTVR